MAAAQVTDISALAGHDALRTLDLSGNAITDVSPLAGLATLDTVRLGAEPDRRPVPAGHHPDAAGPRPVRQPDRRPCGGLADAPLLQELQLGANPLTDLTPLLRTSSLVNLGLDETDSTRLTGVEELRAAGVSVNGLA